MSSQQWRSAFIIAILLGLVFALGQTLLSARGQLYLQQIESRYKQEKGLTEDHEYIEGREKKITVLQSLLSALQYRLFWQYLLSTWLSYSFMGLVCCLLFARTNDPKHTV